MSTVRPWVLTFLLILLLSTLPVCPAEAGPTRWVSLNASGQEPDSCSTHPSVSADGRFVAFESGASDLAAGDANGKSDIFVWDSRTGVISLVSINAAGDGSGNGASYRPVISHDGRYVVFQSSADDLVPGSGTQDNIFVRDLALKKTYWISRNISGEPPARLCQKQNISAGGRWILYTTTAKDIVAEDDNVYFDIFLHDRQTGQTSWLSAPSPDVAGSHHNSYNASISADGSLAVFDSFARDLVADSGSSRHVYSRSLDDSSLKILTYNKDGGLPDSASQNPHISSDGRFVVFESLATNLVENDQNGKKDIFMHELETGATRMISVNQAGDDGGDNDSDFLGGLSSDGRYVVFRSAASNLINGGTSGEKLIYVRDVVAGTTAVVSVNSEGQAAEADCFDHGAISANGRYVAFSCKSANLAEGMSGVYDNIFLHDYLGPGPWDMPQSPELVSPADGAADLGLTPELTVNTGQEESLTLVHWQIALDPNFFQVIFEGEGSASLTLPPYLLAPESAYYWRVRCTVDNGPSSVWSYPFSFTTGPADSQSGVPDGQETDDSVDMDEDGVPDNNQAGILSVVSVVDGNPLAVKIDGNNVASIDALQSIDPEDLPGTPPEDMAQGAVAFKLTLKPGQTTARVTVFFSRTAADDAKYYKFTPANGWFDYSEHAFFAQDGGSATLELEDGGFGDADGVVNGIIIDPSGFGGVYVPAAPTNPVTPPGPNPPVTPPSEQPTTPVIYNLEDVSAGGCFLSAF